MATTALHGYDAGWSIAAYKANTLASADRNIGRLCDDTGFAVIETHRDFQAACLADLIFDSVAGNGTQDTAAYGRQYIACASPDRAACHTAQGATGQHTGARGFVLLDGNLPNGFDGARANDLFSLRLTIAIHRARSSVVSAASQHGH
jgi:hypothetical protein